MRYAIGGVILVLALLFGLGWASNFNSLGMESVFKPAKEKIRRKTSEESRAYTAGMAQELENMLIEYGSASPAQKEVVESVVVHRMAGFTGEKRLPEHLRKFIKQVHDARVGRIKGK